MMSLLRAHEGVPLSACSTSGSKPRTTASLFARPALALAALIAVASSWMTPAMAQTFSDSGARTVTVQATGSVAVVPDMATISTAVVSQARTAADALAENSDRMRAVIANLQRMGLEARDIQTSQFYVQPRYEQRNDRNTAPRIAGYEVTNEVTLRVRRIAILGDVLDEVVQDGANRIGNISFDVSDADLRRDEARREAIDEARRKADLYARAAGADLGQVLEISEAVSHGGPRPLAQARMAESVPIAPGSSALDVTVTVTYALR